MMIAIGIGIPFPGNGVSSLNPLNFSPAIWLDASQETGYANNDAATSASDFSGNGRAFTEATVPPVFKTGVANGKPGFYFDGTKKLARAHTGSGTSFSLFMVVNKTDDVFRVLWTNGIDPYFGLKTARRVTFYQGAEVSSVYSNLPSSLSEPVVISVLSSAGTTRVLVGKNIVASGATSASALKVSGLSNLGGYEWKGHLFEALAKGALLSDAEAAAYIQYVSSKWGLNDRRIIMCDGDSITAGTGASDIAHSWAGLLAASLGTTTHHLINAGISGQTVGDQTLGGGPSEWMSKFAATAEYTFGRRLLSNNILIAWGGTNDLFYGATAASAYADYAAYCTAARAAGYKVAAVTMLDRKIVGGLWTRASMLAFNVLVRANWTTFADVLVDPVTADARFDDHTSALFADQIHPNDAGHAVLHGLISDAVSHL